MKRSGLKRFAPIGLAIALLAILVSIGLLIVQRELSMALQISLAMIIIGVAIFIFLDPERARSFLTGRQARYGSNLLLMGLAFIGIIVVINFVIINNPKRWDLTESGKYTLSPETIETIENLPGNVSIIGFFSPNFTSDQASALLDQYKFHSSGRVDYQFINPYEDPLTAENYNVNRDGTLVLVLGDSQEQVTLVEERDITGAMLRLISPGERTVYFLTGHGEFDPDAFGDNSYNQVKSVLEAKNYIVKKLNLPSEGKIPADAEAVIIAGPVKLIPEEEVGLLAAYLEDAGSLIVLQEPRPMTEFGDAPDPLAEYLESEWGIILGEDMVVDLSSSQPYAPFANQYGDHIITEKMQGITTVYPTARSVSTNNSAPSARLIDLVMTSENSWAETDLASLMSTAEAGGIPAIELDETVDTLGPITLAATMEDNETSSRMVVFGDSDFATDINFYQYGNGDMLVNSIDWVTEQEALINLTPKEEITRLLLPPSRYTFNFIFLGAVIILPGLVLVAGLVTWVQRRRKG